MQEILEKNGRRRRIRLKSFKTKRKKKENGLPL
jgi:hypothetical protein